MKLTSSQLATIRTRPQQSKLYLSVFQPRTVMQCLVNSTLLTRGSYQIQYDTVSNGSFLNVEPGMTLLIGTSAGGSELGRVRIRSITSSQIVIAENAIDWVDNLFLTVLRVWEPWQIFPRIIQDPADNTEVIFYKDWDIPYSNQNSIFGVFPNMGPHRAAFLDPTAQIYYSSSGTYNLGGDTLSYWWTFEGGTPTGSTSAHPGLVTYSAPGHYVTRLSISGTHQNGDVSYRAVSIYNRPEAGANAPILDWEFSSLQGSRDEGGYTASIHVGQQQGFNIRDGSIVVIFSEDWYGSTKQSLGGNSLNNESIFFVGYVLDGSIKYDWATSSVEFDVGSISEIMKGSNEFGLSVEDSSSPTKWFQLQDLSLIKAVYHFFKWHSTILQTTDVQPAFVDKLVQYFDTDEASLFDGLNDFLGSAFLGEMVSDRQGKLWLEQNISIQLNATGTVPLYSVLRSDWADEPSINETFLASLAYIEGGGVAYSGSVTGTSAPLLAASPGTSPNYKGSPDSITGLVLTGQVDLNVIVGNVFASRNAKYPTIDMDMSGNFSNLDIAPQDAYRIVVNPTDTSRNISLDAPYSINDISWDFDADKQVLSPSVTWKAITSGPAGSTLQIPQEPTLPPVAPIEFTFPDIPVWSVAPVPPLPSISNLKWVAIIDRNNGIFYTDEFGSSSSPTWHQLAPSHEGNYFYDWWRIKIAPDGKIFGIGNDWSRLYFANSFLESGGLWYGWVGGYGVNKLVGITDITGTMGNGSTATGIDLSIKDGTTDIIGLAIKRDTGDRALLYSYSLTSGLQFKLNTGASGDVGGYLSHGSGKWILTTGRTSALLYIINDDLGSLAYAAKTLSTTNGVLHHHSRQGNSPFVVFHPPGVGPSQREMIVYSPDFGNTIITGSYASGTQGGLKTVVVGSDGSSLLIAAANNPNSQTFRSSDLGATVQDISLNIGDAGTSFLGGSSTWNFEFLDTNLWLAWSHNGHDIRFTTDFGLTWTSRLGNLLTLCPNLNLQDLTFVYG